MILSYVPTKDEAPQFTTGATPPIGIKSVELSYARQLRKVARNIGDLVHMFPDLTLADIPSITGMLNQYSGVLVTWARAASARMIEQVSENDYKTWMRQAGLMGVSLRRELATAPIGPLVQQRMAEQVRLITSLPLDAAKRVHELTIEARISGRRAEDIATEILRTGEVTRSRADLIAVTEVARTRSALTEARSLNIGAEDYIWHTVRDARVRQSHREMEGQVCSFRFPPTLSDGHRINPGEIYRCRCWAEPVLPARYMQ